MLFSIVIPTYNHVQDCLKPCIDSILQYTDLTDGEIVVSANGCQQDTKDYLSSLHLGDKLKLVWSDVATGYTTATNDGIRAARGEFVILLNNDTVLLPQERNTWINQLLNPINGKVAITGPFEAFSPEAQDTFLIFFCVAMHRDLFKELGMLDEIFSPGYGEDTDFCLRAKAAGYQLAQVPTKDLSFNNNGGVGNFPIYHKDEGTFSEMADRIKLLTKNRVTLIKRYAKEVRLNLGCGDRQLPGFIGVDLYNRAAALAMDVSDLSLFEDNTVDEIAAFHIFEHINPYKSLDTLKEWYRVLKPNGKIGMELPDILEMCKQFPNLDKAGRYQLLNCFYGTTQINHPHLFGWYEEILTEHLSSAGFSQIQRMPIQMTEHWGFNFRMEAKKAIDLPDGFFSSENISTYRALVSAVPIGGTIAELGVWRGKSLCSVGDIIKERKINVIAVDTFAGSITEEPLKIAASQSDIKGEFTNNVKKFGIENIKILNMTTADAASHVPCGSLDLLFIDADHTYEGVKSDIINWMPKVKTGGIISGHDYWEDHSGVVKAVDEIVIGSSNYCGIWQKSIQSNNKIYDGFMFFNELDVLELRLNELYGVVDKFVLVEARKTISRKDKTLIFESNKDRFAKFLDKIIHIVVDDFPEGDQWVAERYQRDAIQRGFADCKDTDIVMVSDVDEIPKASIVESLRHANCLHTLRQRLSYYYIDCIYGEPSWDWCKLLPYGQFKSLYNSSCGQVRYTEGKLVENAGWHVSFLGGTQKIIEKIDAYSHQEYNTDEIKNPDRISKIVADGGDVLGRDTQCNFINVDDSFPRYALANPDRYFSPRSNDDESLKRQDSAMWHEIFDGNNYKVTKADIEGKIVIDAGGNRGFFTILCSRYNANRIYTLEANPNNFPVLVQNTAHIKTAKLLPLALWNTDDQDMTISDKGGASTVGQAGLPTKTITLSTLLQRENITDDGLVLKLDIEGAEFNVLLNTDKSVMDKFNTVFIEIHSNTSPQPEYADGELVKRALRNFGFVQTSVFKIAAWNWGPSGEHLNERDIPQTVEKWVKPQTEKPSVTVEISTKDRYFTTLPLAIMGIIRQTYTPKELIIYDDGEQKDLREHSLYQHLFAMLSAKGIAWSIQFGNRTGQVNNHQRAISEAKSEWIWRVDDDDSPEADALENLISNIAPDVGAVSGLVLTTGNVNIKGTSSKIEDIYDKPNAQWSTETQKCEVDHFNNTFLFRKSAAGHGYPTNLSIVGHREETIFTYEMKRAGWKLLLDPSAVIWHLRSPEGGIRSQTDQSLWAHDEEVFLEKMKEWKTSTSPAKLIVLNNGLGDHMSFKMALPAIKKCHVGKKLTLAVCYPQAFLDDKDLDIISIAQAQTRGIDMGQFDVYGWMDRNKWSGSLKQAFEEMYKC